MGKGEIAGRLVAEGLVADSCIATVVGVEGSAIFIVRRRTIPYNENLINMGIF